MVVNNRFNIVFLFYNFLMYVMRYKYTINYIMWIESGKGEYKRKYIFFNSYFVENKNKCFFCFYENIYYYFVLINDNDKSFFVNFFFVL